MTILEGKRSTEGTARFVEDTQIDRAKRIGVGVCFIIFPAIWVFAFAVQSSQVDNLPISTR